MTDSTIQKNIIYSVRPDAPELAGLGEYRVGVRTLEFTNPAQPDIVTTVAGQATLLIDRTLTVELWYPASPARDARPVIYETLTRDPGVRATLHGLAVRDAVAAEGRFPLVIISHGYPGNRYLLSHLGENLASKGYIVASIDHRDSTYEDQQIFASTLYHRAHDQAFILGAVAELDTRGFLAGRVDASRSGLIGYSMGGYGALNNLGASYSEAAVSAPGAPPNNLLLGRSDANPAFRQLLDPRVKAGVVIAPWGMNYQMWNPGGLAGLDRPTLFVGGDADDIAGYKNGVRAIFGHAVNCDGYLLTYENAGHNAGAPIPMPVELAASANCEATGHYLDPVWDTVRMNNILAHFVTAFFDLHLQDREGRRAYLDLIPKAADGVHALDEDGKPLPTHTYWKGFPPRTAIGLRMEKGRATGSP